MAKKRKKKSIGESRFSLVEDLENEKNEPHLHRHFRSTLQEMHELENWMKEKGLKNNWTLTEKLAFLRNVEARIRTNAAVRRTELAWWAFGIAIVATIMGFIVGSSI
ncbi:MAG: hypothetical protein WCV86_02165 [Patescibacteria group bacterium]|jgi:hypothetical protein